jgi:hypothetical protein
MMNQNMLPSIISLLMLLAAALQDIKSRRYRFNLAFGCLLGIIINLNNYSWSYIPKAIFFLLFLSGYMIMKLMGEADILAYASLLCHSTISSRVYTSGNGHVHLLKPPPSLSSSVQLRKKFKKFENAR